MERKKRELNRGRLLIIEASPYRGGTYSVLLKLAYLSVDKAANVAVGTLSKWLHLSERHARRCIRKLENDGVIEVQQRNRQSSLYTVRWDELSRRKVEEHFPSEHVLEKKVACEKNEYEHVLEKKVDGGHPVPLKADILSAQGGHLGTGCPPTSIKSLTRSTTRPTTDVETASFVIQSPAAQLEVKPQEPPEPPAPVTKECETETTTKPKLSDEEMNERLKNALQERNKKDGIIYHPTTASPTVPHSGSPSSGRTYVPTTMVAKTREQMHADSENEIRGIVARLKQQELAAGGQN